MPRGHLKDAIDGATAGLGEALEQIQKALDHCESDSTDTRHATLLGAQHHVFVSKRRLKMASGMSSHSRGPVEIVLDDLDGGKPAGETTPVPEATICARCEKAFGDGAEEVPRLEGGVVSVRRRISARPDAPCADEVFPKNLCDRCLDNIVIAISVEMGMVGRRAP